MVLIDNYDSFTWNVYQYLVLEGACVTVFRNDEISIDELIALKPTQLVVSPGPGHPDTDAGISCQAIKHFSGRIPVLGVCMGEYELRVTHLNTCITTNAVCRQCIFSVFGGRVDVTGQILHGKTSPLRHDGRGIYAGLSQDLPVTRYHSLAGTHATLPDCLEVSSWISDGPDGGKGIIMGVRHRTLLVEGVQFHPESILTAEGRKMLFNFLHMQGGSWKENEKVQLANSLPINSIGSNNKSERNDASATRGLSAKESILERIYQHRREAVAAQKSTPSQLPSDLQEYYDLDLAPPLISFADRLRSSPYPLSLMAEIKRASPSKGPIAMSICAPRQARKYALAGASVISVLTEPEWFKGSIEDLRAVRRSLEGMADRPAVLRKEFIFDEYQILEARLAGADTILLIVKMLDLPLLESLYKYSKSLGMEPLVEVNTAEEMDIAVKLGAQVIGVNNRNLTNFEVDLDTTSRLMDKVSHGTIVCALSGISGPEDVASYERAGVKGVLVGEALMRATDVAAFVAKLLGGQSISNSTKERADLLVKICGTRTPEAARTAIEAGADLIGMILVPGRKRFVPTERAIAVSKIVHSTKKHVNPSSSDASCLPGNGTAEFFEHSLRSFRNHSRALLVGVFQNQSLSHILEAQRVLDLDVVQLHGSEPIEWASLIPVPVIRRFGPSDSGLGTRGYHALPLLDTAQGGTGEMLDSEEIQDRLASDTGLRVILAGGLTSANVSAILFKLQKTSNSISGVDVSSGVEQKGEQSLEKIREFISVAKQAYRSCG